MLEYILKNGGGTFDAKTFEPVEPKDGYSVGIEFGSYKVLEIAPKFGFDLLDMDIESVFEDIVEEFGVEYVGAWVKDGFVHLDPIIIVEDYKEAVDLGIENGQQEIYSFKDGKSFNTIEALVKINEAINAVANEVEQVSAEFDDLFVVIGGGAKANAKIKKALAAKIKGE
jgi:hypothetical protein